MQQLTGTMITNPAMTGRSRITGPKAGSAGPVTGNRYRGTVRGGRVTGQDRTAQHRTGAPSRRPHPVSGPAGSQREAPSGRPLGPLTRDAGPLASDGVPREWAAQRKDWRPSPEIGGRQADGVRPVRPQHRWGGGRHSLCAGCEGCAVAAERHRPLRPLRRNRRTGAEAGPSSWRRHGARTPARLQA